MSANVSLPIKNLDEGEILDSESITDSEKEDCSPEGSIVGERLRGDGQEQDLTVNKKIDDDEDRRNPQYIPKRGNFYEHDDRTLEDDENSENENSDTTEGNAKVEKDTPRSRKKVWEEKDGEKWGHDLYIEKEQQPKTKQELINAYGYDIRNEDGPPRARRRRRYGRGPNKYTRNWEDEEAYNRSTQLRTRKNPKNPPTAEDFPPLNPTERKSRSVSPIKHRNHSDYKNNDNSGDASSNKKERGVRSNKSWKKQKNFDDKKAIPIENNIPPPQPKERSNKTPKVSRNSRNDEVVHVKEVSSKSQQVTKNPKSSPGRNINQTPQSKPNKYRQEDQIQTKIAPITSQSYSNSNRSKQTTSTMTENIIKNDTYEITRDMNNLSVDQQVIENSGNNITHPQQNNLIRQASVPPRLQQQQAQQQQLQQHTQNEQQRMGPKRYSSLRQRSLPETTPQTFPQTHQINSTGYYTPEFTAGTPQQTDTTHPIHQQMQMSPNPPQSSLMMNQIPPQQIISQSSPNPSTASVMGIPIPHTNAQVRAAHINTAGVSGQPQSVGGAPPAPPPHHQILNAQSAIMAAAAHTQTHPQYGAPQYQVPNAGNASGVYNIQQAVNAGTTAYIPSQPNGVINSVYGQAPPGAQPPQYTPAPYPPYQPAYTAPPAQPPQELYQTQSGITYYSPHNQPAAPKAPLKRPKAAIPILAPPERANSGTSSRGRGRSSPTENNNTGSVTPPRGRGRISPSESDNNFISRGRGRKMSNENNTLDSNTDQQPSPATSDAVESVTPQSEHTETTDDAVRNLDSNKKSEMYSDVVETTENVAQNGTDSSN
ncbi:protein CASC3 isoform X2 [Chrysoperla carnea]|uniref:protein CASC3 isoform X2 n=1 Tax=Chrysoperla carnea TaxID=189513 RepID=UPI001D084893|nr:protein CASC3 isoform X2 [Chrysoperla carnea]